MKKNNQHTKSDNNNIHNDDDDDEKMDWLSDELLIAIALCLDSSSLAAILQTCRRWRRLEQSPTTGNYLWQCRVVSQYGPMQLSSIQQQQQQQQQQQENNNGHDHNVNSSSSSPNEWKKLALRLEQGLGAYHGFAMDAFTSNFEPYPMSMHYQRIIHWPTLRNSMTQLGSVQLQRRQRQRQGQGQHSTDTRKGLESMKFSEIRLLSGSGILIPNHYFGYVCGPAILGVFANGAFCLLIKEALKPEQDRTSQGNNAIDTTTVTTNTVETQPQQYNQLGSPALPFCQDMIFSGLVAMELVNFDPTQTIRDPCPDRVIVQLQLKEQMSPTQVLQHQFQDTGIMAELDDKDPKRNVGYWAQLRIQPGHNDTAHKYEQDSAYTYATTMVLIVRHSSNVEYDVVMETVGHPVPVTSSGDPIPLPISSHLFPTDMVNFFESLKLYGWLHGDCILGLMKNNRSQTGSFYMQLRHCNRLGMLGLQRALEDTATVSS